MSAMLEDKSSSWGTPGDAIFSTRNPLSSRLPLAALLWSGAGNY